MVGLGLLYRWMDAGWCLQRMIRDSIRPTGFDRVVKTRIEDWNIRLSQKSHNPTFRRPLWWLFLRDLVIFFVRMSPDSVSTLIKYDNSIRKYSHITDPHSFWCLFIVFFFSEFQLSFTTSSPNILHSSSKQFSICRGDDNNRTQKIVLSHPGLRKRYKESPGYYPTDSRHC